METNVEKLLYFIAKPSEFNQIVDSSEEFTNIFSCYMVYNRALKIYKEISSYDNDDVNNDARNMNDMFDFLADDDDHKTPTRASQNLVLKSKILYINNT